MMMDDILRLTIGLVLGMSLGAIYFHFKDLAADKKQKSIQQEKARAYRSGKSWWVIDDIGDKR